MIQKLNHYTDFEALDCIMKNKSLRFSRLDTLNDIFEKRISSIDYFDKSELYSTFVSCFSTEEESIPLWCLYARSKALNISLSNAIKHGVQLRFDKEKLKEVLLKQDLKVFNGNGKYINRYDVSNNNEEMYILRTSLEKVIYSDLESAKERYGYYEDDRLILDSKMVGKLKPSAWSYENEVRSILKVAIDKILLEPISHGNYYDLDLGVNLLKSTEIIINPFISFEEFEYKKKELLDKFDFIDDSQIMKSRLTGCITI